MEVGFVMLGMLLSWWFDVLEECCRCIDDVIEFVRVLFVFCIIWYLDSWLVVFLEVEDLFLLLILKFLSVLWLFRVLRNFEMLLLLVIKEFELVIFLVLVRRFDLGWVDDDKFCFLLLVWLLLFLFCLLNERCFCWWVKLLLYWFLGLGDFDIIGMFCGGIEGFCNDVVILVVSDDWLLDWLNWLSFDGCDSDCGDGGMFVFVSLGEFEIELVLNGWKEMDGFWEFFFLVFNGGWVRVLWIGNECGVFGCFMLVEVDFDGEFVLDLIGWICFSVVMGFVFSVFLLWKVDRLLYVCWGFGVLWLSLWVGSEFGLVYEFDFLCLCDWCWMVGLKKFFFIMKCEFSNDFEVFIWKL